MEEQEVREFLNVQNEFFLQEISKVQEKIFDLNGFGFCTHEEYACFNS